MVANQLRRLSHTSATNDLKNTGGMLAALGSVAIRSLLSYSQSTSILVKKRHPCDIVRSMSEHYACTDYLRVSEGYWFRFHRYISGCAAFLRVTYLPDTREYRDRGRIA